jgi:hypothetical protein
LNSRLGLPNCADNPLLHAAAEIQRFFGEREWRFCFIGGLALLRWGQPRFTRDVDVTFASLGSLTR